MLRRFQEQRRAVGKKMVFCSEGWGRGSTNEELYPITLTHEQSRVIRQARKAGLVRTEKEAVEIGLLTLRPQLQEQHDKLTAAAEEEERKLGRFVHGDFVTQAYRRTL